MYLNVVSPECEVEIPPPAVRADNYFCIHDFTFEFSAGFELIAFSSAVVPLAEVCRLETKLRKICNIAYETDHDVLLLLSH